VTAVAPPASRQPGRRGRLVLLVALLVIVAIAVPAGVGVAMWRAYTRRQPTVTDAIPAMDRAIADVLAAAGPDPAVAVTGVVRVAVCRLDPIRAGGHYNRVASLYTIRGDEDTLITRITQALPAVYHASRQAASLGQAAPMTADAGRNVHLSVRQAGYGWITATAATGCTSGPGNVITGSPGPGEPGLAAITSVLTQFGTRLASAHRNTLTCPAGAIVTIAAVSTPTNTEHVADRVPVPPGVRRIALSTDEVAYRQGAISLVVAVSDDGTAITVRHTVESC
jgi:hypothetical protein